MQRTALVPYSRLPRAHHDRHVLTSTVDVFGAAHWLLSERAPEPGGDVRPFDALVVSAHPYGNVELTELRSVRARWPHLDRLPDGGFVVAAARARRYEDADQVQVQVQVSVQVFDELGRETSSFCVGDAIERLLVDGTGHLWVGHFDENPVGTRRWSATGRLAWASDDVHIPRLVDCYALNVSGTFAWACPYADFPLLEIRPNRPDRAVKVRANTVRGAEVVAVHGERVAFYGGDGEERDRLAHGELTETSVEPTEVGLLTLPDGAPHGRRRVVGRGSRIYVQADRRTPGDPGQLAMNLELPYRDDLITPCAETDPEVFQLAKRSDRPNGSAPPAPAPPPKNSARQNRIWDGRVAAGLIPTGAGRNDPQVSENTKWRAPPIKSCRAPSSMCETPSE
ncbi:hypothetical protein Snoj_29990 [Streptomyces nojiriensis]|uniref:Uncharacterized protein n=1 Tax=Streptomyces nojiriensis TaxID=66374 RepID=A0ABQ3SLR7_9ACTN|nr:hypothetical protein [Streptomyces nojiriensis]QTI42664.1 hypothetical protein JYK04_00423 [Streptomyces nojiriensis]GGS15969.1 hypothetical protein GCM10010205_52170 [Streptomyces nojiriensis]GHI69081.1 hypothetical protein Snoj_29990 [Streptomyces nojiriensis]